MTAFKATFLFLLVLLSSCNARHFETTHEDSATGALDAQEEKRDETTSLRNSADEETINTEDDQTRRGLESNSNKRQDDMPGIWGRSMEFEETAQKIGEDLHSNPKQVDEPEVEDEDKDDSPSVLLARNIAKGPPGLWGRGINVGPPGLWGRGINNGPPGLWGRGLKNGPPGLWGREFKITPALGRGIRNGPPGLWGREIRNGPPGLWGRGMRNGPPGLWGREIRNGPPGLWGRGLRNGPPGLWGREIEKGQQALEREISESTEEVKDEKEDVHEM